MSNRFPIEEHRPDNQGLQVTSSQESHAPSYDKLDIFTQDKIQTEVDRITEAAALFLGITLDNLEHYQGFMKDLQKKLSEVRNTKDDLLKRSLTRQLKQEEGAFLRMVQGDIPKNSPWRIKIFWPDFSLRFMYGENSRHQPIFDFVIHERGVMLSSPTTDIYLNHFSADDEDPESISPVPERSRDTYISINLDDQKKLDLPAPVVIINANPSVFKSGTILLNHTDNSRLMNKSDHAEQDSPKTMSTQAAYDKNGKLRYLRVIFVDYDLKGENYHHKTVRCYYDLRSNGVQSGITPDQALLRSNEPYTFTETPEVTVDEQAGTFSVHFMRMTDTFPLKTDSALELVRTASAKIKEALPPFSAGAPQLPEGAFALPDGE